MKGCTCYDNGVGTQIVQTDNKGTSCNCYRSNARIKLEDGSRAFCIALDYVGVEQPRPVTGFLDRMNDDDLDANIDVVFIDGDDDDDFDDDADDEDDDSEDDVDSGDVFLRL
ncbi:hypothetical protein ElyMa_001242700 [Elysia marginata]|uniref:Uncharacterized protein n=1 Tax=Elysia marginata TaxID=1093978 RepID=A0AAV4IAT8_9GAST|nr:hypothetical protein ElyMa_001242700 [Elysia marginata]